MLIISCVIYTSGVELKGNVIILDEAHNIERICEEAASFQIKSTDISLAIEEVTAVMKALSEESVSFTNNETPKDFTPEELCILKEMLLEFEKSLDSQELKNDPAGTTFSGEHVFEILGKAGVSIFYCLNFAHLLFVLIIYYNIIGQIFQ